MSTEPPSTSSKVVRCAIYTRKSTDENLNLEFSTLDAQRVACSAYIASQLHEGWVELPNRYDDGGFSGGTLDRPALQRVLKDVREGRVDVVAVYKVDRLTRSLLDFGKIVAVLEAAEASFVSITQTFNSTTSMGRLTLNVLLSFAQFERELASERVRDKIAASKAKGLWVGGTVPLGYDSSDRRLVINSSEADTVRHIFERYRSSASGPDLVRELARDGVRGKTRRGNSLAASGNIISLGALYAMLRNRLYVGEISYRGAVYKGAHEPIVERVVFDDVLIKLERSRTDRKLRAGATEPSMLTGLIRDKYNRAMVPTHTQRKERRYRYYHSKDPTGLQEREVCRVNAEEIERVVVEELVSVLDDLARQAAATEALSTDELQSVQLAAAGLKLDFSELTKVQCRAGVRRLVRSVTIADGELRLAIDVATIAKPVAGSSEIVRVRPVRSLRSRRTLRIIVPPAGAVRPASKALLKLVAQACAVRRQLENGIAIQEMASRYKWHEDYVADLMRVALLAPSVLTALVSGTQPAGLSRRSLMQTSRIPLKWSHQRELFGF